MYRQYPSLHSNGQQQPRPPTPQYRAPKGASKDISQRLQGAADKQERLASLRDQLLVKREIVRASSLRVKLKRVEAGDAEAALMSELRRFFAQAEKLPASLIESYNKVESVRNGLGVLEDDYLNAERTLSGDEWEFMEQENDFYQRDIPELITELKEESVIAAAAPLAAHLLPPPPPPPLPPPPPVLPDQRAERADFYTTLQPALQPSLPPHNELGDLSGTEPRALTFPRSPFSISAGHNKSSTRQTKYEPGVVGFDGLGEQFLGHNPEQIADGIDSELQLRISTDGSERSRRLPEYATTVSQGKSIDRSSNSQISLQETPLQAFGRPDRAVERARTESALPTLYNDPMTREKVLDWLLTYFKENAMQRALYKNILKDYGIQSPVGETLEDRATNYWTVDGSSDVCLDETITPGTSNAIHCAVKPGPPTETRTASSLDALIRANTGLSTNAVLREATFTPCDEDPTGIPLPSSPLLDLQTPSMPDNMMLDLESAHKLLDDEDKCHLQELVGQNNDDDPLMVVANRPLVQSYFSDIQLETTSTKGTDLPSPVQTASTAAVHVHHAHSSPVEVQKTQQDLIDQSKVQPVEPDFVDIVDRQNQQATQSTFASPGSASDESNRMEMIKKPTGNESPKESTVRTRAAASPIPPTTIHEPTDNHCQETSPDDEQSPIDLPCDGTYLRLQVNMTPSPPLSECDQPRRRHILLSSLTFTPP